MSSIKENIVLNGINTVTSILFPIITFPYAARILMPEGIGSINFLNSIINYIILFTSIGIPLYAVKEVAKYRDDINLRNRVTVEVLILSFILSLLGYVITWIIAKFIPVIQNQAHIFYILSLSIAFTTLGVNWFYQAIEDFRFITIRAIIIRSLSAAALFIFVRTSHDLTAYAFIIVGSTVGNNLLNFIHLRKYFDFSWRGLGKMNIVRHIRPSLVLFALNLIISLYISLNSVMLGFISGDEEVGFFTAGTRISHIGLMMISSIGTVLLPRCSNLLAKNDYESFATIIKKSLNLTLALALPMTCGLMILCEPITMLFCGPNYGQSIKVLFLNSPVIIFIGLTNLMGIQILYPKDKVNIVLWSVGVGAILNLLLNFLLLPKYAALGAAIASLVAEFGVFFMQLLYGRKEYPFHVTDLFNHNYILSTVFMSIIVLLTLQIPTNHLWHTVVGLSAGVISYMVTLGLLKDKLFLELLDLTFSRFSHGKGI